MKEKILSVQQISVRIGESVLLDAIDFFLEKGDFLCITGPNGAGKTTLLKAILGLIPITSGSLEFLGKGVSSIPREYVGYLPQKNSSVNPLFPATVEEVVALGILAGKKFPKRITAEDRKSARESLESLHICDLRHRSFRNLSGGQQQKVLLSRALVRRPQLLIMDEPSTALDPGSREDFFRLIEKLNKEEGITVMIVTHDMDYVGHYANKLLMIDRKMVYSGPAEDFLHKHHITHHHDYAGISHAV